MYKYVLWDLDGTIANTYPGIARTMTYALAAFGYELKGEENIRRFIGPPLRESIPDVTGFDMETTEKVVAKFRERYIPIGLYESELFAGVKEAMDRFSEAGLIQLVTSSKPQKQCESLLEKYGIGDSFDYIFGATLDGRIDTKIQVLEEAFRVVSLDHPDFDKSEAVLIGDTKYDAIGARQAGIGCVGISYGFGTREELVSNGVITVCDTPDAACSFILNN